MLCLLILLCLSLGLIWLSGEMFAVVELVDIEVGTVADNKMVVA